MFRLCTIMFTLMIFSVYLAHAQDSIENRATGTHNHNYFNPKEAGLRADQDRYHTKPLLIAWAQGDLRMTKIQLEWILTHFINHPQALAIAAAYSIKTRNPLWAVPHFERALSIYPEYALTHAQYGKYLVDIGSIDAGIAKLKQAAEMDPNLAVVHVWLATAYSKNGQSELAREAVDKARSLGYNGDLLK